MRSEHSKSQIALIENQRLSRFKNTNLDGIVDGEGDEDGEEDPGQGGEGEEGPGVEHGHPLAGNCPGATHWLKGGQKNEDDQEFK